MDKSEKKRILWEYKNAKPEMGIISFRCVPTGECFLGSAKDTKAALNSNRFQLSADRHPNRELQSLWNRYGEGRFEASVAEVLPYDEKRENQDYTQDLQKLLARRLSGTPRSAALKREPG